MKGEIARRGRSPRKEVGHVVKGEKGRSVEGKGWRGVRETEGECRERRELKKGEGKIPKLSMRVFSVLMRKAMAAVRL